MHVEINEEATKRILHVWDNAEGLSENNIDIDTMQQGINIIKSYSKTLGGKMNTWNDNGFHFKMEF